MDFGFEKGINMLFSPGTAFDWRIPAEYPAVDNKLDNQCIGRQGGTSTWTSLAYCAKCHVRGRERAWSKVMVWCGSE
jgi:hypothetical protein